MFDLEEITWDMIRDRVRGVNSELTDICDQLNLKIKPSLYKIRYPYGSHIIDKGLLFLPTTNKELIPINDDRVPDKIKQKLGYCSIPLSLVLHNNSEVFIETNDRVIPLNFFNPGDFFGVFETASAVTGSNTDAIWSVTAGARSVFCLPKISDKLSHGRIEKEYGITAEAPNSLLEQWKVFKEIYNNVNNPVNGWYNEILIFTNEWIKTDFNDMSWLRFHQYLFKICWNQAKLLRDSIEFGLLWAAFGEVISNKALKPRPYIVDTLKHIISIANGSGVGFKPATDETALPLKTIQEIYINCYQLKNYIPTIMQPCKIFGNEKLIYYSLAFPTTLESAPSAKNAPSIIEDEREIKQLLEIFMKTINQVNINLNFNKDVKYEFFHVDNDNYGKIINSKEINLRDERFNFSHKGNDRVFCSSSLFFRGCIQIKKS